MDKMIVVVFDSEKDAYTGVEALRELHNEGSITVYAAAVIAKDPNGKVRVEDAGDQGPAGTALGLATGSLIGLLGGPVGLAVGAVTGAAAGSMYDLAEVGVNSDFVEEVSQALSPDKRAVVAEIDEEWITPLDSRMEALGGTVFRRARAEFIDAQIEREVAAERAELAQMKAEHDQAVGEAKAKLQAKIQAVHNRLQSRRELMHERIEAIKRDDAARMQWLREQAERARGERKAKLDERIAEAHAVHEARARKLNQAWELIREAATM